jgi:NADPH-dependent curcumin reductase CurA
MTREVVLAARPQGVPQETDFELRDAGEDVELADGEVAIRNVFVSVDPYMRGRMTGVRTYVAPFEVGDPIDGGAVGRVVASKHEGLSEGDWVLSQLGWRETGVAEGKRLRKLDAALAPPSTALGALGMPGLTAWIGLTEIADVKEGETVYVSGAAGAVGSAAVQIAKLKGLHVIGSAGSDEKVRWLVDELGFDAAFNYKSAPVRRQLRDAAPDGIDVYFDNVGGDHLEAAIGASRTHGRTALCGMISQYDSAEPAPGPRNLTMCVGKRLTLRGFIIFDHLDRMGDFAAEVGAWIAQGRVKTRETIVEGFENTPSAFLGLLRGDNVGKMLVRLEP